jgi:hypothetical protein
MPSVLSRMGSINRPGGTDSVLLQLEPGQFKAPASGKILFDVEVAPEGGSPFVPGSFQIVALGRKPITLSAPVRSGGAVFRQMLVAPGQYSVLAKGAGGSTGSFEVSVHMVGDVNGDRVVNRADLQAISEALGKPGYAAMLDGSQHGVITKADVRDARMNRGANAGKSFTFSLTDSTGGAFDPNNVYIAILGNSHGTNVRLDSHGNQIPMRESDNNGPGSIIRDGLVYTPSYCMKLSTLQSKGIPIGEINSGRIWIGLGSPVYFHIFAGGGFTQPNVANPSDPNAETYFDFVEFSLDDSGLHANTSQVDAFAIPTTMNVIGASNKTVGITEPRSALFAAFPGAVPAEFKGLVDPNGYRISSPKKSPTFNKNYYTQYIDEMWSFYQTRDLSISTIFGTYIGRASGSVMTFRNPTNGSMYKVEKPSSADVIGSDGSIVTGDEKVKAIKARISAMIQRHVATAPTQSDPSQYYLNAPANYYSLFWHQHSLNNLAYGFDYDDVFDQSSSINDANPILMKINVTWG